MSDMEFGEVFREEAVELLEELETSLLELEDNPTDMDLVGRVFRAMHTIKGSSAMFGFDDIAGFTHHVETVLDQVRNGTVMVNSELINLTLNSRDHIRALMDASFGGDNVDQDEGDKIIAALGKFVEQDKDEEASTASEPADREEADPTKGAMSLYRIQIKPDPSFFDDGGSIEPIIKELNKIGTTELFPHHKDGQETAAIIDWLILLTSDKGDDAVDDILMLVESNCSVKQAVLSDVDSETLGEKKLLGQILVDRGDISKEDLDRVMGKKKFLGEILVENKLVTPEKVESALAEQKKAAVPKKNLTKGGDSIRVASEKLDILINLVGEMVVTQARLSQVSSAISSSELLEPVEEVERLTAELRDCVLNMRMLPIGTTFARFKRLVRDLSSELNKEITLFTSGAETELDKNVIEQLGDPMVHLIRNSIDHGIEVPAEREAKGKPGEGSILLSATHAGANVVITVADDGKGLDVDLIHQKAVEKGIFRQDEEISEAEILNSIFAAGLTTATEVTSVSGRGVGMDVVKSTIERLKGTVEVKNNTPEPGSTVTIVLPLTLAIIDGLLIKVENTHFVLPLSQIEECVELTRAKVAEYHDRRVLPIRGQLVPYVRLREFFDLPGERPELEQVVITKIHGERCGLVLDDVVGEHQTVLKSLGWIYRHAEGISGSTILGNGEVALMVDIVDLIRCSKRQESENRLS